MVSSCGRSVPGYQASTRPVPLPSNPSRDTSVSVPGAARGYARESGAANPSTSRVIHRTAVDAIQISLRLVGIAVANRVGVTARLCPRPPRAAHPVPVGGIDEAVDVCSLLAGIPEPTPIHPSTTGGRRTRRQRGRRS